MRACRSIPTLILPTSGLFAVLFLFLFGIVAYAQDRDMVLDGIDGDVTTNECKAFNNKLKYLPPPPINNIGNLMVDEKDGARLHGMQTFYAFTHDRRDLDMAIVWSDAFLHARNNPTNGRVIWTGKRDLCWPNEATNAGVLALHSGAENGDVIEHIANTARLILQNPAVWNKTAPPDKYGFGKTYLERAKTYVRECQRSADTTIVPWFVRNTKDGYRLHYPDSAAYFKSSGGHERGPIPWNQQQALVGAFLRLVQCHRLLNDGNTNIAYYEKIAADTAHWFFASAVPVSAHNHVCYDWAYVVTEDPAAEPESTIESDYDMFIFRTYQANLGPTRLQMQRLINTAQFVMYQGTNRIAGHVDGTNDRWRGERRYLDFQWIEMSVLDHDFYDLAANIVLTSHEYWNNLAVEAAMLSAKHYWATHSPMPEPQEDLDPSTLPVVPPAPPSPLMALILRHTPHSLVSAGRTPAATMLLIWIVSGLFLIRARRLNSRVVGPNRWSGFITWMHIIVVAMGVFTALRLRAAGVLWPGVIPVAVILFGLGLALQLYAVIKFAGLAKANVAGSAIDRVIAPHHFIRRLNAVGRLLAIIGLSMSFKNWASLLIMCVPCCVVALWRIRAAGSDGKGGCVA